MLYYICRAASIVIGNTYYKACEHEQYTLEKMRECNWLTADCPAHKALKSVITNNQLVSDMKKMNENIFTTYLEVFHSLKIRYLPKSIFFEQEKMVAGMQLAALDHNNNINRDQVGIYHY